MAKKRGYKYTVIPTLILRDRRVSAAALQVFVQLASHADEDGYCYPSLAGIGDMLGCTRQAVQHQIKALGALGYLTIMSRKRDNGSATSNGYQIHGDVTVPEDCRRGDLPQETADSGPTPPQAEFAGGPQADALPAPASNQLAPTTLNSPNLEQPPHPLSEGGRGLFEVVQEIATPIFAERQREFEMFWAKWPGATGSTDPKKPAFKSFCRARRDNANTFEAIMAGLERDLVLWAEPGKLRPMAQTWLNQERWIGKHGAAQPRNELQPEEARSIRSRGTLNGVLMRFGISAYDQGDASKRREFVTRNGIDPRVLS